MKNYITPAGFSKLQNEFMHLRTQERPALCQVIAAAAANGDRSENADYQYGKRRLREIDRRLAFLQKRLEMAEVVPLPVEEQALGQVVFGATVTIQTQEQEGVQDYTIVGVDEVNLPLGQISWQSPIGRELLQKQVGDVITVITPSGKREMEIMAISYRPSSNEG